jgi:hypothetical protein
MKNQCLMLVAFAFPLVCHAADYEIDLGLVTDLEDIRPLIDGCSDLGSLENYRSSMESATDLENLRDFLEVMGVVLVSDCPEDVEASGVTSVED